MDELSKLKLLAGVNQPVQFVANANYSMLKRQQFIKEHNIRPGTNRWFKVMFANPDLTGEDPYAE